MAITSYGTRDQPQVASSGNPPDFAEDLTAISDFFAARSLRRFATVAALIASTGSGTDDYAVATNAPGALFRNTGSGWMMYGVPVFADSAARATALSAPAAGWRSRLESTGLDYVYNGSAWALPGAIIPTVAGTGVTVDTTTGLVSFTAATAVSLNDCFPSGFTKFDIVASFERSASLNAGLRLRLAGTDNAASNYDMEQHFGSSSSSTALATPNATQWANVTGTGSARVVLRATLFEPNTTAHTLGVLHSTSAGTLMQAFGLMHDVATAFDGLSLIAASGNITGTLAVKGLA